MARDGERFLERTRLEFLEDLMGSFGERSDDFGSELKVLLFEMWVRARSRSPFPEQRPEPTDDMKQAEFDARLATALASINTTLENPEFQREFVKSVQRTITVGQGITRNDKPECLALHLDPTRPPAIDQKQFSELLDKSLRLEGKGLDKWLDTGLDQVELEFKLENASADAAGIPELDEFALEQDETQKRLVKRLEKLGVMPPAEWVPVFQHRDSGVFAGIDVVSNQKFYQRNVETYLFYDQSLMLWQFPNPKPIYTYDDCPHIRMWIDGVEQMNSMVTWTNTYDNDIHKQVVENATIPNAMSSSSVKAVYTTFSTEYGS
jgi:hypothetical protein